MWTVRVSGSGVRIDDCLFFYRTLSSDYSEESDLIGAPFEELNQMTGK